MSKSMTTHWIDLDTDACRQYIDARSVFTAWEEACRANKSERVCALGKTLVRHQRMNWALYVGNAPRRLIDILFCLGKEGLAGQLTVVGPCSLFAYESEAGIRLRTDPNPPARNNLILVAENKSMVAPVLEIVQKTDKTFKKQQGKVINNKGFEVEVRVEPLNNVELFSSMVVARSGHMARMHTVAPFSASISGFEEHLLQILRQLPLAVNMRI